MHGHPPTLTLPRKGGGDTTAVALGSEASLLKLTLHQQFPALEEGDRAGDTLL
jgi:hypothetical protein